MQNQLQQAINLARKTGDRLIIFDNAQTDEAYVVLTLRDYENLVLAKSEIKNLTEDELLDKINRDIAVWKSEQEFDQEFASKTGFSFNQDEENFRQAADEANQEYYNFSQKEQKSGGFKRGWSIPSSRKQSAEEVIEEDRQYLEEVPF